VALQPQRDVGDEHRHRAEHEQRRGIPRPVLILVRIDSGQAIDRALDRCEPAQRAIVDPNEVDAHRFRDGEHETGKDENLQPPIPRHIR
jgi:hypothetical protein